jgi:hypothetical protein
MARGCSHHLPSFLEPERKTFSVTLLRHRSTVVAQGDFAGFVPDLAHQFFAGRIEVGLHRNAALLAHQRE